MSSGENISFSVAVASLFSGSASQAVVAAVVNICMCRIESLPKADVEWLATEGVQQYIRGIHNREVYMLGYIYVLSRKLFR